MFCYPRYLTENINRDVVVSDNYAVVVANYTGKHRFSYKGPSSEPEIEPRGICTDVLSRILVCDLKTHLIQNMIKMAISCHALNFPKYTDQIACVMTLTLIYFGLDHFTATKCLSTGILPDNLT